MSGSGTVIEYVPQVCIALRAKHLRTAHEKTRISFRAHILAGDRLGEAWPAASGVEFRIGVEYRRSAALTNVFAGLLAVVLLAVK